MNPKVAKTIAALDEVVSALNGSDVMGPCWHRKPGGTCLSREHNRRKRDGSTIGFLNYDPARMCDPCLACWHADCARVLVLQRRNDLLCQEAEAAASPTPKPKCRKDSPDDDLRDNCGEPECAFRCNASSVRS